MLPKHLYRQRFYKVILMGDKAGQEIEGLTVLFAKANFYPLALRDDWRNYIGKNEAIAEWRELNEEASFSLAIELDSLGASGEVSETTKHDVFDEKLVLRKVQIRFNKLPADTKLWDFFKAGSLNKSYSDAFLRLEDYAFILWAKGENIEEAYRLAIMPSFDAPKIFRMYKKDALLYFVYKQGSKAYVERSMKLAQASHLRLEASHWEKLAAFMDENFWAAQTWYSHYLTVDSIYDGEIYLFEGWKNGRYKFLADHSPKKEAVSEQAFQLFRAIKIHAMGESLGHKSKFLPPIP